MENSVAYVSAKEGRVFTLSFVTVVQCSAVVKVAIDVYTDISVATPETLNAHVYNALLYLNNLQFDGGTAIQPQVYHHPEIEAKQLKDVFQTCSRSA